MVDNLIIYDEISLERYLDGPTGEEQKCSLCLSLLQSERVRHPSQQNLRAQAAKQSGSSPCELV